MGGDFLVLLLEVHPEWATTLKCLVRDQARGESLKIAYPNLQLVYGTLDDAEVLENEAANAEVVLHFASSDHVGAAEAISRGLKKSGGYWIHTSGTDILLLQPSEDQKVIKPFNDWDGIQQCTSRPGTLTPVHWEDHC